MPTLRQIRYRLSTTRLRGPKTWLHHRGLQAFDVFLASYPRSGNTWLRFLLAECLTTDHPGFDNINTLIPEVGMHRAALPLLPGSGRLIKTHERYRKEYGRAIYLVRDIRNVILSNYSRARELGIIGEVDLDKFTDLFMRGTLARMGTWQEHVLNWLQSPLACSGNLLVVRFEDVRHDPPGSLVRILNFLHAPIDHNKLSAAIANNTVDRMRAKEDKAHSLHQSANEKGRFVRKGSVAGWRETLSPAQVAIIEAYAGEQLRSLGYELNTGGVVSKTEQAV